MRELATVHGDVVVVRPGLQAGQEVRAAAVAALGAGLDPARAALDAQLAILDRALAQLRGGR